MRWKCSRPKRCKFASPDAMRPSPEYVWCGESHPDTQGSLEQAKVIFFPASSLPAIVDSVLRAKGSTALQSDQSVPATFRSAETRYSNYKLLRVECECFDAVLSTFVFVARSALSCPQTCFGQQPVRSGSLYVFDASKRNTGKHLLISSISPVDSSPVQTWRSSACDGGRLQIASFRKHDLSPVPMPEPVVRLTGPTKR
jgi:hypothetical protein